MPKLQRLLEICSGRATRVERDETKRDLLTEAVIYDRGVYDEKDVALVRGTTERGARGG